MSDIIFWLIYWIKTHRFSSLAKSYQTIVCFISDKSGELSASINRSQAATATGATDAASSAASSLAGGTASGSPALQGMSPAISVPSPDVASTIASTSCTGTNVFTISMG